MEPRQHNSKIDLSDVNALLKIYKRIPETDDDKLRIAVLGSNSIQHLARAINALLYLNGINSDIYEGQYDGIAMNILNPNSDLYSFKPRIVVLIPDQRDIKFSPELITRMENSEQAVTNIADYYGGLWKKLESLNCKVLQANFVIPPLSQLGNLEANYGFSKQNLIQNINLRLAAGRHTNVNILDFETLASNIGKFNWCDYSSYFLTKQGFSFDYIGYTADLIVKQILAQTGKTNKCLVLDLDNTLWGGVVGDVGYDGIQLDPNNALGESYRFFQRYILELKQRGVILAVCSKNQDDIAREPFIKNKDMVLKLEDISCFVANWEDKATNIQRIAKELNIGLDSLVFFDDNPAEREIVKNYLPEVTLIDVPEDPANYALALDKAHAFEWLQITKEDLSRSESYRANAARQQMQSSFVDYEEYLEALDMIGSVGLVNNNQIERFSQLINKTNQFNLRTKRYSEAEILGLLNDQSCRLIKVELSDKFCDYGLIACVILKKIDSICFIDTWLMSCRVLKRGVEDYALNELVAVAASMGCEYLVGEYIPSKKNAMVKDFYRKMGFNQVDNSNLSRLALDKSGFCFALDIKEYSNKEAHITERIQSK